MAYEINIILLDWIFMYLSTQGKVKEKFGNFLLNLCRERILVSF